VAYPLFDTTGSLTNPNEEARRITGQAWRGARATEEADAGKVYPASADEPRGHEGRVRRTGLRRPRRSQPRPSLRMLNGSCPGAIYGPTDRI
jgi:hypothetical protein